MANRLTGEAKQRFLENLEERRQGTETDCSIFLRRQGWEQSCDFPGAIWLWCKRLPSGRLVCVDQSTALIIEENLD
jgi:hypothetical protein